MSYRTNRKTGGVFRVKDYSPAEIESQARRFICPRCEALMGHDMSPATAAMHSRISGHEIPGTPISSFVSRAELNEHIRTTHPGQRLPTKAHRKLGKGTTTINITNAPQNTQETVTEPMTPETAETPDEGFMTETEIETAAKEEIEGEKESMAEESGEGFTDDDGQIFDGQGGLLD